MTTLSEQLTEAFAALRKDGYYARKNFWCCTTCGCYAMNERMQSHPSKKGYVFYHAQDVVDVKKGSAYLAWDGDATTIINTLKASGIDVTWNGDEHMKIQVQGPPSF
jgi:hypothetical protein